MAPLVLGGEVRPGHAIGSRAALALGEGRVPADRELAARVDAARLRRTRRLAPVDAVPDPSAAVWALSAAFHDVLQSANPTFDAPLRRGAAVRILDLAIATLERVPVPETVGEGLARHVWLARAPEISRTDTAVRWWVGKREYLGVDPPPRLQAWPDLRRVQVERIPRPLLDLAPIAVDRARLAEAMDALLLRSPLTDLASCTRAAPSFAWRAQVLAFVTSGAGRALALRALDRLDRDRVDEALGNALRQILAQGFRSIVGPALALFAERALMEAERGETGHPAGPRGAERPAALPFARAIGALEATRVLSSGAPGPWSPAQREALLRALSPAAGSPEAREGAALLGP
jgi:hypothetical protein